MTKLVFIISLLIFWFTANPLPSGYADADELATTAHFFSVAHPPGYGLNVILIGLFQRLFFFVSPAYAANLFAGLLHALTLTLLYQTAILLLPPKQRQTNASFLALGFVAAGLNGLFWLYASVIEVMSLGNLITAAILFFSVSWAVDPKPNTIRSIVIISVLTGLGIGHLQTLILLLPGLLILYLFRTHPQKPTIMVKHLGLILITLLLGFLTSSLTIIPLNARQQEYSWTFPYSLQGWWHMVTRQDYSGTFFDQNRVADNPYIINFNLNFIFRLPHYLITTWNHFAGLPTLLILLGFYYLYKKPSKTIFWFFLSLYGIAGLLFGTYVTLTDYRPDFLQYRLLLGTAERQYLLGYTLLLPLFSLGAVEFFNHLAHRQLLKKILVLGLIVSMFSANYSLADQKHNSLVYDYNHLLLTHAKPNAIIICSADFSCFGLYYQSLVEGKRPDVTILSKNTKARLNYLKQNPQYYDYLYPENPSFTAHLISHNLTQRPVYLCPVSQFDIDYIGLDGNPFFVAPNWYLPEISTSKPTALPTPPVDQLIQGFAAHPIDRRDFHLLGFKDYLASYYQVEGRYKTLLGFTSDAAASLERALYFNANDTRVVDWRLQLNALTFAFAEKTKHSTSSAEYLTQAQAFNTSNQLLEAETSARRAHYLNPTDPTPLKFLLNLYQQHNYPLFAGWTAAHLNSLSSQP